MNKLKPCPCGRPVTELTITDSGQGTKWGLVSGNCCGEWMIEFRTEYNAFSSDKCMELAIKAWDDAPRVKESPPDEGGEGDNEMRVSGQYTMADG